MKFTRMKAKDVAELLMRHPEKVVLIEDTELCLTAHDKIHIEVVDHSTLGECVSLSALGQRVSKNFKYKGEVIE